MTLNEKLDNILAQCRAVLALADKATPGPWTAEQNIDLRLHTDVCCRNGQDMVADTGCLNGLTEMDSESNATFIATSRTLTPRLARATITAIEMLRLVDIYDASPRQSGARNTLQRIADEWERSGVDGVPKTNQLT